LDFGVCGKRKDKGRVYKNLMRGRNIISRVYKIILFDENMDDMMHMPC
jgi:hypothetical protein